MTMYWTYIKVLNLFDSSIAQVYQLLTFCCRLQLMKQMVLV